MGKTGVLETGVDKLVELIKKEKKISIKNAAVKLGVSTALIEEWANFLEEEGLLDIDYKVTTPYLTEKQLSKEELEEKKQQFYQEKEILLRKAENTLEFLDDQGEEIKTIRQEFQRFKSDIDKEIELAKKNLRELEDTLSSIKKKEKEIEEEVLRGREATNRFQQIVNKKQSIEELVKKIDKNKTDLREQVIKLIGIVKSLGSSMDTKENKEHIKDLQEKFTEVHEKKLDIEGELKELSKLIKGMT